MGVGVSFGGGSTLGVLISIAIARCATSRGLCGQPDHGSAAKAGVARAAGCDIVTSLPQPLVAIPAFLFVEQFRSLLPLGLGFAGGAMLWMVVTQLLADALRESPAKRVGLAAAPRRPPPCSPCKRFFSGSDLEGARST